jgi:hypothetical protein
MDPLERLQRTARLLRPVLPLAVLLGVAGAIVFLWAAAGGDRGDGALILGLVATLWGALLFALITGFRQVPPPTDPRLPLGARLRSRVARGAYAIMAWAMLGAAVISVIMTYRLMMLWAAAAG